MLLLVGVSAIFLAVLASVPLGLISGYNGGWIDTVIMRYIDLQWALPSLITRCRSPISTTLPAWRVARPWRYAKKN